MSSDLQQSGLGTGGALPPSILHRVAVIFSRAAAVQTKGTLHARAQSRRAGMRDVGLPLEYVPPACMYIQTRKQAGIPALRTARGKRCKASMMRISAARQDAM